MNLHLFKSILFCGAFLALFALACAGAKSCVAAGHACRTGVGAAARAPGEQRTHRDGDAHRIGHRGQPRALHRRRGADHGRLLGRRQILALSDRAGAGARSAASRSSPASMSSDGPAPATAKCSSVHFNVAATGDWWAPPMRTGLPDRRAWRACASGRRTRRR